MTTAAFETAALASLGTRTDITADLVTADCEVRLNEEGGGSLTLPFGESISSPYGKAVVVSLDSTDAFSWVIEGRRDVEVDPGEEARMVTEYYGRGIGSLLDRYRFGPTFGPDAYPWALTRTFSAFSLEYDFSGWDPAVEYALAAELVNIFSGEAEHPEGFPAFDVYWIGPAEGDDIEAPYGYWWTQTEFTLADDSWCKFFYTADDDANLYVDGHPFGSLTGGGARPRSADTKSVYLSAGTHRVGARVVNNFGNPNFDPGYGEGATELGNPTFLLLAGYLADADGRLGTQVVGTDSSWKLLAYQDEPPGMTDAEVIQVCINEAIAAGVDPEFTFDGAPSGGSFLLESGDRLLLESGDVLLLEGLASFTPVESITVDVGQSLLEHLRDRADGGWIDWYVPPSDLILRIWPAGARGSTSGVTYSTANGNLTRLHANELDVDVTGLHVAWVGGWTFVGTHEKPSSLRTRAATLGEAKALAQAILDRDPQPEQVTAEIVTTTNDVPGVHVLDGDTVTAGTYTERMIGWSMSWPSQRGDEPAFDIDLKDRIRGDAERLDLMVRRAAPGQMGGSAPSSPAADPPATPELARSSEPPFQALKSAGSYVIGPSDVKRPGGSGNLYAVAATATVAASTDTEFEFLVDGVDVLGGTGVLPAGETFVLVPVAPIVWVIAGVTEFQANLTTIGTGLDGFLIDQRFV